MAKSFRPVMRDQPMLLPVDMREWLPGDHLVWFVLETVDALDVGGLEATRRRGGAGAAGFDPRMLLALLVYAYCQGVRSSRQIERLCRTDVAFRVVCAQDVPDHSTIARFRNQAGGCFTDLFAQVLQVAAGAGLGVFGTVAIDGTKIRANASVDANREWDWFTQQAVEITTDAESVDAAEDCAAGDDEDDAGGPDRVPASLRDPSRRAERIREAAAGLEAQRKKREAVEREREQARADNLRQAQARLEQARAVQQAKIDAYRPSPSGGRPPAPVEERSTVRRARAAVEAAMARAESPRPGWKPKEVANTTDPQSRLMPTRCGFVQGYNTQVAVTGDQLIIAVEVSQRPGDQQFFEPMMRAAEHAAAQWAVPGGQDQQIGVLLADAGYSSNESLTAPGPDRLIALGKRRAQARQDLTSGPPPPGATAREAMAHRLRTAQGRALYKRRGATVEPAIGNLKKLIDRFAGRGLSKAHAEIHLAAAAFNLRKVHQATLAG